MQKNVETVQLLFPSAKISNEGQCLKFSAASLSKKDLYNLYLIEDQCDDQLVKRSGTGLTIILTFKKIYHAR